MTAIAENRDEMIGFDGPAGRSGPEILALAADVPCPDMLAAAAARGCRVVRLDRDGGLSALADAIADTDRPAAVHVVSHGAPGALLLGEDRLDRAALARRAPEVAALARALAGAPLVLYGCEIGAGAAGRAFVAALSAALDAPVRASETPTGAADRGGDWTLGVASGAASGRARSLFDEGRVAAYPGLLAPVDPVLVTNTDDSGEGSLRWAAANLDSGNQIAFSDLSGTISLLSDIDFSAADGTVTFSFDGATSSLTIDGFALDFDEAVSFDLGENGSSLTVASHITGGNALSVASGSLTLGESNQFSTASVGEDATLTINVDGDLGTGAVTLDGGTLSITGTTTVDNDITLGVGGGRLSIAQDQTVTLSGAITGTTSLTKSGAGSLVLTNTANEGGSSAAISISNGALSVADDDALTSGAITMNGGSLYVTGATTIDNAISFSGGGAIAASGADVTLSGAITGDSSFSKLGANVLTLSSGSNTYSGNLTVSAGTLRFSGAGTIGAQADVSVSNGASLDLNDTSQSIGSLSGAGDVTLGAGTLTLEQDEDGTFSGEISGTGSLVVTSDADSADAADSTLTLSGDNGYSGTTTVSGFGILSIAADANLGTGDLSLTDGTLVVTGTTDIDNAIAVGGTGESAISVSTGATVTLSGALSGSSALHKESGGTLILTADNSGSTAALSVDDGAVSVAAANNLTNATVTLSDGSLYITGDVDIGNSFVLSGASGGIGAGGDATVSGGISGDASLNKLGSDVLTLSGSNSYGGSTTVSEGTLRVTGGSAITNDSDVTVSAGTSFHVVQSETIGALSGGGGVTIDAAQTLTVTQDEDGTVSGVVSGDGALSKGGTGTLTLSGENTYLGTTTITSGTLSIAADANLGADNVSLNGGNIEITGSTTIDNTVSLDQSATVTVSSGATATLSGVVSGANSVDLEGSGTLTLTNTGNEAGFSGGILIIDDGGLSVADDDALTSGSVDLNGGSLTITGATDIDNDISVHGATISASGADATISGVVSGGSLTKTGANVLTLTGTNTFSGTTTISGGTLRLANGDAIGDDSDVSISLDTSLDLNDTSETIGSLSGAGDVTLGSGTLTVTQDSDATFSGDISGTGNLVKDGASTLTLTGSNSNAFGYSGTTTINAGTLSVAADGYLGSGDVTLDGGTLGVTGTTTIDNGIALGAGNGTVQVSSEKTATLSGVVSGTADLTKTGAGTLSLSATNTYQGTTTVSAGTLLVDGELSDASTTVTVQSGGTLGGSGSITGTVTVASGGTINAGNSPGQLSTGDLSLTDGSTALFEIEGTAAGTGYDQIVVTGTVDLGGATLQRSFDFDTATGQVFTLIDNDDSDEVTGTFAGLIEKATFESDGRVYRISYIGGDGNDVTLTDIGAVPSGGGGGDGGGDGGSGGSGSGTGNGTFIVVPDPQGGGNNASITNNGSTGGGAGIAADSGTGATILASNVPPQSAVVASGPTASASAGDTSASFVQALQTLNPNGVSALVGTSQEFFGGSADSTFLFQQVTLTASGGVASQAFVFSGTTGTAQESIIVDATGLSAGNTVQVDDIEIVAFTGPGTLTGGAGSNRITASDDAQTLSAGVAEDTVYAGGGDDYAFGNQGSDILFGNQGTDTVFGGQDTDTVFGGQDDDFLFGNLSQDILLGNVGADVLYGGQGEDVLYGGQDADVLVGGVGSDTLVGGLGDDLFSFGSGSGSDTISDFSSAEGDRIEIVGDINGTGISTAADILARLSTDADGNAVIDLGDGQTITLTGIAPGALTEADFTIV